MSLGFEPSVWRAGIAPRAAVLIDVEAYYGAVRELMAGAQRSVLLLNWAFESRTRLDPAWPGTAAPEQRIGELLKRLADRGVDVRVLCWKTALPVAATQDFFPLQDRRSFAGAKVRFELDGRHPFGACHHQKAVIVDDALALCGGADFGQDRWDTDTHPDHDPRRLMPGRRQRWFASRHEAMAMVDGAPAQALGELFRERWRQATGEVMAPPQAGPAPRWPTAIVPEFSDVRVAVSRTQGAWRARPEIRENLALALDSIAAARRTIYMENQYFTSPVVAEALAERLAEPDGPEVVLISTQHSPHWFDRMTMDRSRGQFIRRLMKADRHHRFHIYSPVTALGRNIIVHAKVTIVDDAFVRVGSTNMNNRSSGFDTECDLSLEASEPGNRTAAARVRARLVAHWLGCPRQTLEDAVTAAGGVGPAIEALRATGHVRLRPIRPPILGPVASFISAFHLGDPVGPKDSFRPLLRRRRLAAETAEVATRFAGARLGQAGTSPPAPGA